MRPTPPKPAFVLRISITGHRPDRLPAGCADILSATLRQVFRAIGRAAGEHYDRHRSLYRPAPPQMVLLTGLAEGSDRLAAFAIEGLAGWRMHAVLPFEREAYRRTFATSASTAEFDALVARSHNVTELDGVPTAYDGYGPLAQALVRGGDCLLAVWDGQPARGVGGTANVVFTARQADVPIIHIDPSSPDLASVEAAGYAETALPASGRDVEDLVHRLCAVPDDTSPLLRFFTEYGGQGRPPQLFERTVALLTSATGGPWTWPRAHATREGIAEDPGAARIPALVQSWQGVSPTVSQAASLRFGPVMGWSDDLARWYAGRYRSGFTSVFLLTTGAVSLGMLGRAGGALPPVLAGAASAGEIGLLVAALFLLARMRRGKWQERWLDYRALAERMRHLWFLWPVCRTLDEVRVPVEAVEGDPRRGWVAWLVRASAREAALPPGTLHGSHAALFRDAVLNSEAVVQREFHTRRRQRLAALGGPLGRAAERLVIVALAIAALRLAWVGVAGVDGVPTWGLLVTAAVAGLAPLAASLQAFGNLADFEGLAVRSAAIEGRLAETAHRLRALSPASIESTGALLQRLSREMETEIGAWHAASASRRPQAG